MKIGRFLALGALAYGAYYAYKRREDIKEEILDLNQSRENISMDSVIVTQCSFFSQQKVPFNNKRHH